VTRLTTCPDAEAVAARAAVLVARQLDHARDQRGCAHLALSGGSTPERTYELLAAAEADWTAVEVWFADERCVGPEDPDSNYRMAADALLERTAIPAARVHRMEGELGPGEGASRYGRALLEAVPPAAEDPRGPPALDVVVLGIGPDGHIASLFPGSATLDAPQDATCLGVWDSPKPPPERITLTLPVLHAARSCLLIATGAGKADAVSAMLGEPTRHVPASLLRRGRLTAIVDDAAAPPGPRL